jgi:hypothetical protein
MDKQEFDKKSMQISFAKPDVMLFAFQVLLIFIVVCVSLLNLTLQWGNLNLWTVILTGSLGYIMPNPKLKADIEKIEVEKGRTF